MPPTAADTQTEEEVIKYDDASLDQLDETVVLEETPKPGLSRAAIERQELLAYFSADRLAWKNVNWGIAAWMLAMHIGAVAAFFFITWQAVVVALVLHWVTCSIGICLTYHRALSHRSLKLKAPAKFIGTLCGVIAGEGGPLTWTSTHRVHHGQSDQPGDPHSPLEAGGMWAHLYWMMLKSPKRKDELLCKHYVPDLTRDKMIVFFEKTFALWLWATGFALLGAGYYFGGWPMGLSMLFWGLCFRMTMAYHSTWFVNSATHLWGYRNYETTDASRNLWWVAILSYGEGWHNNHHAHPRLARAGHKWWELDPTFWAITFLKTIGQATDVDDRIPASETAS